MTQRETLLAAARNLTEPFALESLIVAAWKLDAAAFGLPGFEQSYPDARKVSAVVFGRKGLVGRGDLQRDRDGYRLANGKPRIPYHFAKATETDAYKLFVRGAKASINWGMAREFWGDIGADEFGRLLRDREQVELRQLAAAHDYLCGRFAEQLRIERGAR